MILLLCLGFVGFCKCLVSLPPEHYPFYFHNNPRYAHSLCENEIENNKEIIKLCSLYKSNPNKCWGYEKDCTEKNFYLNPNCPGDSKGWTRTRFEQKTKFFEQADFGYVRERIHEIKSFCKPRNGLESSSLECSKYLRHCKGRNVLIDFKKLKTFQGSVRYREDVIDKGLIGGYDCALDNQSLADEGGHKSPLQSWYNELGIFTEFTEKQFTCDVTIDKPTFIMKLDATVNMFHHFCDFINLFITLHVNNSFSTDNNVLIWDNVPYRSNFGVMWKAFTNNRLLNLSKFTGQKVCFKDVIFPLLPRMVFGMYYNMPLVPGCQGSGLFHAFNRHILHGLNIPQDKLNERSQKVRITLISRNTKYRKILNEAELLSGLDSQNYEVRRVDFNHQMSFSEQLKISSNSDILIGMHGAGLTHCLFQPDWGVLFELYNCEDVNCYQDLAHLRGLKYITWEINELLEAEDEGNHPQLGAHLKFTNYKFNVLEFKRLIDVAVNHVLHERSEYFKSKIPPIIHQEL